MSLEMIQNRLVRLEKQNRFMKVALALIAVAGIIVGAAPDSLKGTDVSPLTKNSLTLVSPNGKHRITLMANNSMSGVWLNRESTYAPSVAIYNDERQGAVLGVWGDHTKDKKMVALDAAISAGSVGESEAVVQAVDANRTPTIRTLVNLLKGVKDVPKPQ